MPRTAPPLAATPRPTVALVTVVHDTFDTPLSGWLERETPTWNARYAHGRYLVATSGQPAINLASSLDGDAYRLSADVAVEHGSAGLVFLAAKPATFYRFVIATDGAFALQRQEDDQVTTVVDWMVNDVLQRRASSLYRLRVERQGAWVQCVINEVPVLVWTIPDAMVVGQYGVAVAAVDGQAAAAFDNLRVER
jgi:hypothetical protein